MPAISNVGAPHTETQEKLSDKVFNYYNTKGYDRNQIQAELDPKGYVHHHFGIGGLDIDIKNSSTDELTMEIQRLENDQMDYITKMLNVNETDRVLDLGCGRGGTMFKLVDTFGCSVQGINLTEYQTQFCAKLIKDKNLDNRCKVDQGDFMNMSYERDSFDAAVSNEVSQYAYDLNEYFANVNKVLKKHGEFVIATWCYNDHKDTKEYHHFTTPISLHYASTMHGINEYLNALNNTGFKTTQVLNVTEMAIPYWEARTEWELKSGVEPFFLNAHKNDDMRYYFICAKKI